MHTAEQRAGSGLWACTTGLLAALLAVQAPAIRGLWPAVLYAATWITLRHAAWGAWVLAQPPTAR